MILHNIHPTPVWSRSFGSDEVMTPCNLLPMLDLCARASVDEIESCNTQPGNSMEDHCDGLFALMIPSQTCISHGFFPQLQQTSAL